jgi:hypothetical protein
MVHHTYCMNCMESIHSDRRIFIHDNSGSPFCGVTIIDAYPGEAGLLRKFMRALGFSSPTQPCTIIDARYKGSHAVPREWRPGQ